ncbi:hypothetical protein GGP41_002353 [Bipolaris sorokiniana]|uniref:N-acetyltransferase domain-containing protein n=2 Tax=Cochliobolus sativus TaxID=45130 RepID=A0A8H6DVM7_COCSA|nr:uncharacterized protein COCSADRAFT_122618 [Bipolaris sorokiniana ND90Pr]EMD62189.1 hypothetical protein COCSADRAFT_122618 [Bipolaris sorokiniana ND90Pr]KAF5850111.1 hypothetical protein GGP41_002353 [Bipolaris sorokiniana]
MPLEVHRITSPDDLRTFAVIQIAAFASGGGIASLLNPEPVTDEHIKKYTERHVKSWRDEHDVVYLKVVDTDLDGGKMIAGAKWRITEKEKTEEEAQKMYPTPEGDDLNNQALVDFLGFLYRARKQYVNTKPICFLQILVTDPDHHRRGAGSMLLKWGLGKADELGLPGFLEASPMGKPLYERMGFRTQETAVFDLTKYGAEGEDTNTIMIREPSPTKA